jgi:Ran GTPase-activating protein (RanGAP) involved in mRNA processing and transport
LHLKFNRIRDIGINIIAEVIKVNDSIQYFDLSANGFSSKAMDKLAKALAFNSSILKMFYFNDQSSDIARLLKKNNKRFEMNCKMCTYELFKQISLKKSSLIDMNIAGIVLKVAGIVDP